MRSVFFFLSLFLFSYCSTGQVIDKIINKNQVEKIEKFLSADDLEGRQIFTSGINKAADFIEGEFKAAGLKILEGENGFKQSFAMIVPKLNAISATINNAALPKENIVVITSRDSLSVTDKTNYEKKFIRKGDNFRKEVTPLLEPDKNILVFIDTSFKNQFQVLKRISNRIFESENSVIFILTSANPENYSLELNLDISRSPLANVVGVLPGKTRKNEYVIFSAHYDHLGKTKPIANDSIFNGANDDASGVTAVIMLAKYYKALAANERTLIFVAFTGEEEGGFGSQFFSKKIDPAKVVSMVNIEMIGTESKWGKNSAYITGFEQTNMGDILSQNLKTTQFKFHPDPYPEQQLFYRSDNATLARLGVPAHTVSTSKMDSEKHYHTLDDEIENLDLSNMTSIIQAIALSAKSIISGKDTPTRVKASSLK